MRVRKGSINVKEVRVGVKMSLPAGQVMEALVQSPLVPNGYLRAKATEDKISTMTEIVLTLTAAYANGTEEELVSKEFTDLAFTESWFNTTVKDIINKELTVQHGSKFKVAKVC